MSLVLGLSPVLLAPLPGLKGSGVVSVLLVGPRGGVGGAVRSKMPLSPLVLRQTGLD